MNKQICNPIGIIATGFIVLILLSLVLFGGRFFIISNIHRDSSQVTISPSGLIPDEPAPTRTAGEAFDIYNRATPGPNEPNFRYSRIYTGIAGEGVLLSAVGALWDIMAESNPHSDANEIIYYFYADKNNNSCFDKHSGLIIRRYEDKKSGLVEFFAGPNGVSVTADSSLGRFYDPIIIGLWGGSDLYDKKTRCFYAIDFDKRKVSKGPQLAEGDSREPIVMTGGIRDRDIFFTNKVYVEWSAPKIWNAEKSEWKPRGEILPGSNEKYDYAGLPWARTYIPVLDKTGRINIYNTKEQSLTQCGYLPMPKSLFMGERQDDVARPVDVLAYDIWPVSATRVIYADSNNPQKHIDVKYLGLCVACVSREGMTTSIAVFGPNGNLVYRGASAVYSGSAATGYILFFLENLQPPVFEVASYLCGSSIEASAGHQALFILPNSFVGMLGRYNGTKFDREVFFPILMGPSLFLSVWLAFRVRKDAKIIGLSSTAKKWWTIGTAAFGLPAYITYRLTRPKETLVTCQNCGYMRRPDMETCHRCGSKWEMPELTPPNWRICD